MFVFVTSLTTPKACVAGCTVLPFKVVMLSYAGKYLFRICRLYLTSLTDGSMAGCIMPGCLWITIACIIIGISQACPYNGKC